MTLRIGVYAPTWPPAGAPAVRWPEMRTLVRDIDASRIETLWVADEPGFWECWTFLTAIAAETSRVGIGPLVANTRYRNPALFVTMVRALDEISGGRLVLGLGGGSAPADRRLTTFGFEGADGVDHHARNAEATEIIARLLREGPMTFEGRLRRVEAPDIGPAGPRPAGPPIWIAARKPRAMEVAVRWGDAVNGGAGLTSPESVAALRADIARAAETVGRDPADLEVTGWARIAPSADGRLDADRADTISGTPEAVAARLAELAGAGLAHLTCFVGSEDEPHLYAALTPKTFERLVDVVERLGA